MCPKQGYTEEQEGFGLLLVVSSYIRERKGEEGNHYFPLLEANICVAVNVHRYTDVQVLYYST